MVKNKETNNLKDAPLISVVMSVYNGKKYLAEAIESILNQTYKNFELIIVNDGSKDNSIEIIKSYMNQDNRIVLIDRENKGLPYSLNEGISIAKGEYIARMDADDISLPERFEKQIDFMQKNKLDVCGSHIKRFRDNKKERIIKNPVTNEDIRFSLLFFSSLAHPTVMFKKEVFDKVKYHIDYKVAQDYQLWCDIANANLKMGNISEVLLNYREHEAQASIEKSKKQQDTAQKIALEYAKNFGNEETNLVKQITASKKNIGIKELKKLFDDIKSYANKKNIQNDLIFYVLKQIYVDSNPKSPMKYFLYRKATKNSNQLFKEEMNMFLKSFIIFSRDSMIYQFLKRLKNNAQ
jgi:glycosyltransferase involved in cell wall biosynthesis